MSRLTSRFNIATAAEMKNVMVYLSYERDIIGMNNQEKKASINLSMSESVAVY